MSALIQQTEEWLEFRRGKIGSSDSPVIMGVSPWSTPYQLWLEKLTLKERRKTKRMQDGLEMEEKARACFEKMTGLFVLPDVALHPNIEWMIASLDGIDIERKHIVEIKCPGQEDHSCALQGKVPDKYYPQLQHQLEVCQLEMMNYFSFDGEHGKIIEVFRDDKYIKKMIAIEKEFWNCLMDFIPPKMTDRDYVEKNDNIWKSAAEEWKAIQKQIKDLEPRENELRKLLVSMSENQNSIGSGVKVQKILRKGSIDYANIIELKLIDVEPYRKEPVEYWKIS